MAFVCPLRPNVDGVSAGSFLPMDCNAGRQLMGHADWHVITQQCLPLLLFFLVANGLELLKC